MSDEERLQAIETLSDNTEQTGQSNAVDNDHALSDAHREHQFSTTISALQKEKTKRRSKPLLVFVAALLIAALGGAAALAVYKAYFEKPTTPSTQPIVSTPAATPKLTAKEIITLITPKLSGSSPDTGGVGAPAVKSAGYDFYVMLDRTDKQQSRVARVISGSQAAVDAANVAKVLTDKGFVEKKFTNTTTDGTTYATYTHADVACAIENTEGSIPTADHVVSVACADTATYAKNSAIIKPFAVAYLASINDPTIDRLALLFAGQPVVKDSKTTGYKTAQLSTSSYVDGQMGIGGFQGLYYQTPDKAWHYFIGAQSIVGCDKYNTVDLKKAFVGERCGMPNGSSESTVSL